MKTLYSIALLLVLSISAKSQFVQVTQTALGLSYESVSGRESIAWPITIKMQL